MCNRIIVHYIREGKTTFTENIQTFHPRFVQQGRFLHLEIINIKILG